MRLFSDDEELNPPDPNDDPWVGMRFFRDEMPIFDKTHFKDDGDPKMFKDD